MRQTLGRLAVELADAERLGRRFVWHAGRGEHVPALASMVKVVSTELLQRLACDAAVVTGPSGVVTVELFGDRSRPPGAAGGGRLAWEYLERVHASIGAGANEVHRDTIAVAALGRVAREG